MSQESILLIPTTHIALPPFGNDSSKNLTIIVYLTQLTQTKAVLFKLTNITVTMIDFILIFTLIGSTCTHQAGTLILLSWGHNFLFQFRGEREVIFLRYLLFANLRDCKFVDSLS